MEWSSGIGYNEARWNFVERSPAEKLSFDALLSSQQTTLARLGFDEKSYDCCLNHYDYYSWTDLERGSVDDQRLRSVISALATLGHDQGTWDNDEPNPATDDRSWEELSAEQRAAATTLCYSKETWNGDDLSTWPVDAVLPGVATGGDSDSTVVVTAVQEPTSSSSSVVLAGSSFRRTSVVFATTLCFWLTRW